MNMTSLQSTGRTKAYPDKKRLYGFSEVSLMAEPLDREEGDDEQGGGSVH